MIPLTAYRDKNVAVFGLGLSGLATSQALKEGGANIFVGDDNPKKVDVAGSQGLSPTDFKTLKWNSIESLILSPGVPLTHPKPHWVVKKAKEHNVEIIGDFELFARQLRHLNSKCQCIAVTGTNGKSTTTALISHMLTKAGFDVQLGGNIGTPILSLNEPKNTQIFVAECSSYQIELAPSFSPTIGVLLNITPDHLERHGNFENYVDIKSRLVNTSLIPIVGADDKTSVKIAARLRENGLKVNEISTINEVRSGIHVRDHKLIINNSRKQLKIADLSNLIKLRGQHNEQNAAAATLACLKVGLTCQQIVQGLNTFPGLAHRMEEVAKFGSIQFINDSKATNADATSQALSTFDQIYWIVGGRAKSGGITILAKHFHRVMKAYLIGESTADFANVLEGKVLYKKCGTIDQALKHAFKDAVVGNLQKPAIILSPACASFDQYPNFEKRGEYFKDAVLHLIKSHKSRSLDNAFKN